MSVNVSVSVVSSHFLSIPTINLAISVINSILY